MIDINKRKTLKAFSVSAGALATGTVGAAAVATFSGPAIASGGKVANAEVDIQASTRISVLNNDLEVVLTNTSKQPVVITQITPQSTQVARGEFNFAELLNDGAVPLAAGESVSVPLQRKPVSLVANPEYSVASLTDTLRESLTVITTGDSMAKVSVAEYASFA